MQKLNVWLKGKKRVIAILLLFVLSLSFITSGSLILYATDDESISNEPESIEQTGVLSLPVSTMGELTYDFNTFEVILVTEIGTYPVTETEEGVFLVIIDGVTYNAVSGEVLDDNDTTDIEIIPYTSSIGTIIKEDEDYYIVLDDDSRYLIYDDGEEVYFFANDLKYDLNGNLLSELQLNLLGANEENINNNSNVNTLSESSSLKSTIIEQNKNLFAEYASQYIKYYLTNKGLYNNQGFTNVTATADTSSFGAFSSVISLNSKYNVYTLPTISADFSTSDSFISETTIQTIVNYVYKTINNVETVPEDKSIDDLLSDLGLTFYEVYDTDSQINTTESCTYAELETDFKDIIKTQWELTTSNLYNNIHNSTLSLVLSDTITNNTKGYIYYVNSQNELESFKLGIDIENKIGSIDFSIFDKVPNQVLVVYTNNDVSDYTVNSTNTSIPSLFSACLSNTSTGVKGKLLKDNVKITYYTRDEISGNIVTYGVDSNGNFKLNGTPAILPKNTYVRFEDIISFYSDGADSFNWSDGFIQIDYNESSYIAPINEIYKELYALSLSAGCASSVYAFRQNDVTYIHFVNTNQDVCLNWCSPVVYDDATFSMGNLTGNESQNYIDIVEFNETKIIEGTDENEIIKNVVYDEDNTTLKFDYSLPTSARYMNQTTEVPVRYLTTIDIYNTDYYPCVDTDTYETNPTEYENYIYFDNLSAYVLPYTDVRLTREQYVSLGEPDGYITNIYSYSYINPASSYETSGNTEPFSKPTYNNSTGMWDGSITIKELSLPIGNYSVSIAGYPVYTYGNGIASFEATKQSVVVSEVETDNYITISEIPETTDKKSISVDISIFNNKQELSKTLYNIIFKNETVAKNTNKTTVKITENGTYYVTAQAEDGTELMSSFYVSCFVEPTEDTDVLSDDIGEGITSWVDSASDSLVQTGMNGNVLLIIGVLCLILGLILIFSVNTKKRLSRFLCLVLLFSIICTSPNILYAQNNTAVCDEPDYTHENLSENKNTSTYGYDLFVAAGLFGEGTGEYSPEVDYYVQTLDCADFRYFIDGSPRTANLMLNNSVTSFNTSRNFLSSGFFWFMALSDTMGVSELTLGDGYTYNFNKKDGNVRQRLDRAFADFLVRHWDKSLSISDVSNFTTLLGEHISNYSVSANWASEAYPKLHSTSREVSSFEATRNDSEPLNVTDSNNKSKFTDLVTITSDTTNPSDETITQSSSGGTISSYTNCVHTSHTNDCYSTTPSCVHSKDDANHPASCYTTGSNGTKILNCKHTHSIPAGCYPLDCKHECKDGICIFYKYSGGSASATYSYGSYAPEKNTEFTDALCQESLKASDDSDLNNNHTSLKEWSKTEQVTKTVSFSGNTGYTSEDAAKTARNEAIANAKKEACNQIRGYEATALNNAKEEYWKSISPNQAGGGYTTATYPSRAQIVELLSIGTLDYDGATIPQDKKIVAGDVKKLYAIFIKMVGEESWRLLQNDYINHLRQEGGMCTTDIRSLGHTTHLLSLNVVDGNSWIYSSLAGNSKFTDGTDRRYGLYNLSGDITASGLRTYNQIAYLASGYPISLVNTSVEDSVQNTECIIRAQGAYTVGTYHSTTTIDASNTTDSIILKKGQFGARAMSELQNSSVTKLPYTGHLFQVVQGGNSAWAYCWAGGLSSPPSLGSGSIDLGNSLEAGSSENDYQDDNDTSKLYLVGQSNADGTTTSLSNLSSVQLRRIYGTIYGAQGALPISYSHSNISSGKNDTSSWSWLEAYYFEHIIGTYVNYETFSFDNHDAYSVDKKIGMSSTESLHNLLLFSLAQELSASGKGGFLNGVDRMDWDGTEASMGTNSLASEEYVYDHVSCNGEDYYLYVWKESATTQPILFWVKGRIFAGEEVNGNVTETYDPETQETQSGSQVTQYKPDTAYSDIEGARNQYVSLGNPASDLVADDYIKQSTPNTEGFNLYSVGEAYGVVAGTSIRYDALRNSVTNAAATNAKPASDGSTGIQVKEPDISTKTDVVNTNTISVGKYLDIKTNAAKYASLCIPTANFKNITLIEDNESNLAPNGSAKATKTKPALSEITDPIQGLHKAFELNGTSNFTSAAIHGTLNYEGTGQRTNIVRNKDTTVLDAEKREFHVAGEIYVKEHEVKSYLYTIQVHIEVDDDGTRNSDTVVTKKEVVPATQVTSKKYNVQDSTTVFQVDGSLTTWAANKDNNLTDDTANINTDFIAKVESICNEAGVVNEATLKARLEAETGHAELADEIIVGMNRAGNDTYAEDTAHTQTGQYRGYTVVTIAIDWPSGLEEVTTEEEETNESADKGTEGNLWLHQEELNYWFGNMVYASDNTLEWRLKKQSETTSKDLANGILTNQRILSKYGYSTYVAYALSDDYLGSGKGLTTSIYEVTYNKVNWKPLDSPATNACKGAIVIRETNCSTIDYKFNAYQENKNYELELTDLTYGPEALEDEKAEYLNEYYDVAFNVGDSTYKYNLKENAGRYLGYTSRFSRHGLITPYIINVNNSEALGTLITYSFNHVRTFNNDNRNISSISSGAPGNNGDDLDYIKKILRNNTGNVWSGSTGTPVDAGNFSQIPFNTTKQETGTFTEIVRMKAVSPYTHTTLRYNTISTLVRKTQISSSKPFYDANDIQYVTTGYTYTDITSYIKFQPFSVLTKGKTMTQANNFSSLVNHSVHCHALKYTAQDRTVAYAQAKILGSTGALTKVNGGKIYTIGLADGTGKIVAGTQSTNHFGCIAQVKDNGASVNYLPEVTMTVSRKNVIGDNPSSLNLRHLLTLTMAEKTRHTEQESLYIMSMQNTHVRGVTYSESAMAGIKDNDTGNLYVSNGSDLTLKIDNESVTANLYGYSLDVIDKNVDSGTYTVPQFTVDANGYVTNTGTNTYHYNALINDNANVRDIWGNASALNSNALLDKFKLWANEIMKPENYGVDADLTVGSTNVAVSSLSPSTLDSELTNADSLENIDHYDGFSGSFGTLSSKETPKAEYVFPLVVSNGELVQDSTYRNMICQIAEDYSTSDWKCTYAKAEELFENSGLKYAILDAIESNNDADNTSDNPRDDVVGAGNWNYNLDLNNEISLAYNQNNWYDEKVKTVVIRRYTWKAWHFNDIVLEDKLDINESSWDISQWNNNGATCKWFLNIFFQNDMNTLNLNFAPSQVYTPNALKFNDSVVINGTTYSNYGTAKLKDAHDAGSVILYNAYVHNWSNNMKSDFTLQTSTSVNDFDW